MAIVCNLCFGWWSRLFQPSVSKMDLLLCSPKHSVILRPRDINVASISIFKLMGMKTETACMIYSLIFNSYMFLRNCLQLIMLPTSVATTYKFLQVLSHAGWLDQNRASATFHREPSGISLSPGCQELHVDAYHLSKSSPESSSNRVCFPSIDLKALHRKVSCVSSRTFTSLQERLNNWCDVLCNVSKGKDTVDTQTQKTAM